MDGLLRVGGGHSGQQTRRGMAATPGGGGILARGIRRRALQLRQHAPRSRRGPLPRCWRSPLGSDPCRRAGCSSTAVRPLIVAAAHPDGPRSGFGRFRRGGRAGYVSTQLGHVAPGDLIADKVGLVRTSCVPVDHPHRLVGKIHPADGDSGVGRVPYDLCPRGIMSRSLPAKALTRFFVATTMSTAVWRATDRMDPGDAGPSSTKAEESATAANLRLFSVHLGGAGPEGYPDVEDRDPVSRAAAAARSTAARSGSARGRSADDGGLEVHEQQRVSGMVDHCCRDAMSRGGSSEKR